MKNKSHRYDTDCPSSMHIAYSKEKVKLEKKRWS